ncbi:uncharacterized protein [Clytia hemisphaerica]|uniref:NACHT domain-containing protein n=1 Tax=Clytia hemisphaerica TaxID=252671 RepID=A0A7M5XKR1_9CNID
MSSYVSVANAIKEIEHWLRLTCFLHDPIKNSLLQVLHNKLKDSSYQGIPDNPVALYQFFSNNKNTLNQLVQNKILKKDQLELLLPTGGNQTFSSEFDVTLIALLIQNFTNLPPPKKGWKNKNPPSTDTSIAAFVIRAREWRNFINHIAAKTIDLILFQQKWQEGCDIIKGLKYTYNTTFLETMPLDPKHNLVLKSLKKCFAKLKSNQKTISDQVQDIQCDVFDIQIDATTIKKDVADIRRDVADIQDNVTDIRRDAADIRRNVADINTNISEMDKDLGNVQKEVTEMKNEIQDKDESIAVIKSDIKNVNTENIDRDSKFADLKENVYEMAKQIDNISQAVELLNNLSPKETKSGCDDFCLLEVRQYVSYKIGDQNAKLLQRLGKDKNDETNVEEAIENVPWFELRKNLMKLGRCDMVEYIEKNTLITEGLYEASRLLKQKTIKKLIDWLVKEPFSLSSSNTCYVPREEKFVNLTILNSTEYEKKFSNSDREILMNQRLKTKDGMKMVDLFQKDDDIVVARGVAGCGKTSLVEMYNLKWAKGELDTDFKIEFMFTFACRELNNLVNEKTTLEELFKTCYPDVFELITLDDLKSLGSKVMIVIDGLDELHNIYELENKSVSDIHHVKTAQKLIDQKFIPGHKTIVCGRPKACQFLQNSVLNTRTTKTVEICGFTYKNTIEYIRKFFNNKEKSTRLIKKLRQSDNLRQMCTIPIFLWIVCHIFNEQLIPTNLETITEIYFYSCLVFLRNHLRINNSSATMDFHTIVNDRKILNIIYSLMKLSTKLYMNNQVIFTSKEMGEIQFECDLEKTGFFTKFEGSTMKEPTFQFTHLVFQEFFSGMYLAITKSVALYKSNRELTSCLPTILGVQRMLSNIENKLFVAFFNNLEQIYQSTPKTLIEKALSLKNRIKFNKYISDQKKLPNCMIRNKTVFIDFEEPKCTDFLATYFEARFEIDNIRSLSNFQVENVRRFGNRNVHFFITQHNLPAKLPSYCKIQSNCLKVENEYSFGEWMRFVAEDKHRIDRSTFPDGDIIIDESYSIKSPYFVQSLYFMTQIRKLESTDFPKGFILNNTLMISNLLEDLQTFIGIVFKEKLKLPQMSHCLADETLIFDIDIEKIIFILKAANIRTIEIPEYYLVLSDKETIELKQTLCSPFTKRLETEKIDVMKKGLSLCQLKESLSDDEIEHIHSLLQNANIKLLQSKINHDICPYGPFGMFEINCNHPQWQLKLAYPESYDINYNNVSELSLRGVPEKYYVQFNDWMTEMNNPIIKEFDFDLEESVVNKEFVKLVRKCVKTNLKIIHVRFTEYVAGYGLCEEDEITLRFNHPSMQYLLYLETFCEEFLPERVVFSSTIGDGVKTENGREMIRSMLTYVIEKKMWVTVWKTKENNIVENFKKENKFDTYENLKMF